MQIPKAKFSRRDHHIRLGKEAAERCISINGLQEHCDYYCPLNLRGDAQGKINAAEFKHGWDLIWDASESEEAQ